MNFFFWNAYRISVSLKVLCEISIKKLYFLWNMSTKNVYQIFSLKIQRPPFFTRRVGVKLFSIEFFTANRESKTCNPLCLFAPFLKAFRNAIWPHSKRNFVVRFLVFLLLLFSFFPRDIFTGFYGDWYMNTTRFNGEYVIAHFQNLVTLIKGDYIKKTRALWLPPENVLNRYFLPGLFHCSFAPQCVFCLTSIGSGWLPAPSF